MSNRFKRSRIDSQTIRAGLARRALRATTHARISTEVVPTPGVSAGGTAGGAAGGNEVISA